VVAVSKNELQGLITLLFSIEFSMTYRSV